MEGFIDSDYFATTQATKLPYSELTLLEEKERYERMNAGVDPVLMANMFRVQTELMHKHIPTSLYNDARASAARTQYNLRESAKDLSEKASTVGTRVSSAAHSLVESAKENFDYAKGKIIDVVKDFDKAQEEFAVETNEGMHKFFGSLSKSTEEIVEKTSEFSKSTNGLMSDISDNLTGLKIDSMASEEKERARRISEGVDPVTEGKKHRVESELLHSVKLVN